jgi:hypothetical protein
VLSSLWFGRQTESVVLQWLDSGHVGTSAVQETSVVGLTAKSTVQALAAKVSESTLM